MPQSVSSEAVHASAHRSAPAAALQPCRHSAELRRTGATTIQGRMHMVSSLASASAVFVERVLVLRTATGEHDVRLRLLPPERDPTPGNAWRCNVAVTGAGLDFEQHAYGEDGLQALVLALELARVRLRTIPLPEGASLTWLGEPDLGLPIMFPDSPVR
jgi:hypothetical protein